MKLSGIYGIVFAFVAIIEPGDGAYTKLTVFYEPNCQRCQDLLLNQVKPALEALGGVYNSHLEIDLIPYGSATTEWKEGERLKNVCIISKDCHATKGHACAKGNFPLKLTTEYRFCSLESLSLKKGSAGCEACAKNIGMDFEIIRNCVLSWEGDVLMAANGIKKNGLSPKATEHPWILVNDEYKKDAADGLKANALATLCKIWKGEKHDHDLPKACDGKV
ncbi:unnamed protein product [Orchesella dallaii]|uniref:Gamma-interferon-inducible lysosomal thiol reductase n=1 Tax=Orchesella dallaii TaxID=48710 RepID=A0ABP1PI61_9HEXA